MIPLIQFQNLQKLSGKLAKTGYNVKSTFLSLYALQYSPINAGQINALGLLLN